MLNDCTRSKYYILTWGHGGALVIQWPLTSEVGGSNPEPRLGKMVVSHQWSAVYSTEP